MLIALTAWAPAQPDIEGVLLVGSYARGTARPDSDIDLVILTRDPGAYLGTPSFAEPFGTIEHWATEDWGRVTSQRVWFAGGPEVEFGFALPDWAAQPLDPGTARVVADGVRILYDRHGRLAHLC